MKQTVNARSQYQAIKAAYKRMGKENVRFTQSTLLLTHLIDGVTNKFVFPILENDPNKFIIEKRLNINDEFIINGIGIYLVGNVYNSEVVAKQEFYRLFTTPLAELSLASLNHQNLYNGQLSIAVNNIKYLEKWSTHKHQYTGVTQAQNSTVGQPFATLPNADMQSAGMVATSPNITLSGAKKNSIELDLIKPLSIAQIPFAIGTDQDAVAIDIDRIAIVFEGWLAQNAAVFQK